MSKGTKIISSAISIFENVKAQLLNGIAVCEKEKEVSLVKSDKALTRKNVKVAKILEVKDNAIKKVEAETSKVVVASVENCNALENDIEKAKRVIANLDKLTS